MKKTDKSHIYQNYQRHLVKATVTTNNGINNFDRLIKVYGADANRIELLNKLRKQSKFTIYWFLSFVLLGAVCLVLDFKNSWFNIFDLYILMVNIYLVARGKLAGMYIGAKSGDVLGEKAEVIGGVMLILIGIKTLVEHLVC